MCCYCIVLWYIPFCIANFTNLQTNAYVSNDAGEPSNPGLFMMTSSNGNIFRVTGHLCGEFTDDRWIPHTKAINSWVNNREAGDLRRYRAHYDVIVMYVVFGTNIIHFRYEPPTTHTHTTMQHIFVCLYFHHIHRYILRMCFVIVYEPYIIILHACALWRVTSSALVAIIESELPKMKVLECWRSIVLAIKAHYHLPRFHTHKKPVC